MNEEGDKMSLKAKLGYGVGTAFNMMCFGMVNTYMLAFYHGVLQLSSSNAGLIALAGRISSGVSTVIVGLLSDWDKTCWLYEKFGRRKVLLY